MPRKSFGYLYRLVESGEAATASRVEELLSHLEDLAGRLEAAAKGIPVAPPVHQEAPASPAVSAPIPAPVEPDPLPEQEPAPAPAQRPAETPWKPTVKPTPKPVQPRGRGLLGGLSDAWQRFRGLKDHVAHSAFLYKALNEGSFSDEAMEIVQGIRQVTKDLKAEFQKVAQQGGNQELVAQMRSMMDEFGSKLATMGGGGMGGGDSSGGGKSKVNMQDLMYNLVQLANAMELVNGNFAAKIPEGTPGREAVVRVRPGQNGQWTADLPTTNPGQLRRVASTSIQSGDTQWTVKVFFPKVRNAPEIQSSAAQNMFTFDITDEAETIEATNWVKETAPIVFNELLKRLRGRIGNRRKVGIPGQADDYDSQGPAIGPRPDADPIKLVGDSHRQRGRRLW